MEELFASLIQDFVDETGALAREASRRALEVEAAWEAGAEGGEPIRGLRGTLHTIKGNASMMGLGAIARIAHALEDLLAEVSSRPGPGARATAGLLHEGCALLERVIEAAGRGEEGEGLAEAFLAHLAQPAVEEAPRPGGPTPGVPPEGPWIGAEAPGVTVRDGVVDELLELIHESIIGQGELQGVHARFARGRVEPVDVALLGRVVDGLNRNAARLRDHVLRMRLSPIGPLFRRFQRYVRDLAEARAQPVALLLEGEDVAVDRAVIARLSEPLVHIVRNAVAHGLESPEQRALAGKAPEARILLAARVGQDRVRVLVADDGRGLDLAAITAKAAERGIDVSGMGEREVARLIFHTGFSTASTVTSLAGRGMGLDVVAGVVQALGGTVDVRSRAGVGTVFLLDLPVTLSLQKVLLFGVDSEVFALPAPFVARALPVGDRDLASGPGGRFLVARGARLPALDGGHLLGCHGLTGGWTRPYALVARKGTEQVALLVDWLSPVQELLVKPLDPLFGACALAAGVTVTGKGRVVPVLEVAEIVARAKAPAAHPGLPVAEEVVFHDL